MNVLSISTLQNPLILSLNATDAAKASARNVYVSAYGDGYLAEATSSLADARTALVSEINAEKTLNSSLWTADETAHSGELTAFVAANPTSDASTYLNGSIGGALTSARAVASAFGTYQIASRQARYDATASSNPRKPLYAQDVQWATNTKSLRDQFGVAASDAIADYYSTLTSSYATMVSSALTATVAAETAAFSAAKAYSIASLSADGDYSVALFDAAKTKAFAYLAAKVAQIKADYVKEAEPAWTRASLNANPSAVAPSFEIDLARDRHNRYASHSWRRARVAANVATRGNTPSSKVDARRNATPKHGRFGSS